MDQASWGRGRCLSLLPYGVGACAVDSQVSHGNTGRSKAWSLAGARPPSQSQLQSSSPQRSSSSFRTPLTENSAELTENNQHSSLRINEGPFIPELRCPGFVSPGLLRSAGCCVSRGPLQLQEW